MSISVKWYKYLQAETTSYTSQDTVESLVQNFWHSGDLMKIKSGNCLHFELTECAIFALFSVTDQQRAIQSPRAANNESTNTGEDQRAILQTWGCPGARKGRQYPDSRIGIQTKQESKPNSWHLIRKTIKA